MHPALSHLAGRADGKVLCLLLDVRDAAELLRELAGHGDPPVLRLTPHEPDPGAEAPQEVPAPPVRLRGVARELFDNVTPRPISRSAVIARAGKEPGGYYYHVLGQLAARGLILEGPDDTVYRPEGNA